MVTPVLTMGSTIASLKGANKFYARDVLQTLVYLHLYLFAEPRGVRQRACQLVDIKPNSAMLLTAEHER
jgi:hypothetical protein